MVNSRAEAFAPATVANLGVGFDILGMAVEGEGDRVLAELRDEPGAVMLSIEGDAGQLPLDTASNVATVAVNAFLRQLGTQQGVGLHLKKGLPLASGLGSSAASAVAAVVAVNALLGEPMPRPRLLPACLEGEAAVSGYHADNVAPALLGGIVLVRGTELHDLRRLPVPDNLRVALVTPDVHVPTAQARAALPQIVALSDMVKQMGAVADLVDALYRADIEALGSAMEADVIVEPARKHLMPLLDEVRFTAHRAGARGLFISGAGPTLCAICHDAAIAARVADAMQQVYTSGGYSARARHARILRSGAHVIDAEA
jgi:homoserine kinase